MNIQRKYVGLIVTGSLLMHGSMWVGAWGQEMTRGGYYEEPALHSAAGVFIAGLAALIAGIICIITDNQS